MKWNNGTLWLRGMVALVLLLGLLTVSGCGNKQPAVPEEETAELLETEDEQAEDAGGEKTEVSPRRRTKTNDEEENSEAETSSDKKNQPGVIALETRWEGGVLTMPCTVNGLKLRFIFDTGASSVCISSTEALFMLKNGYLDEEDIGESIQSVIANGDIVDSTEIVLREVEVGGIILNDIEATVTHGLDAPLLFGQSAIRQLGTIQIQDGEVTIVPGRGQGIIKEAWTGSGEYLYNEEEYKQKGWLVQKDDQWCLADDAPWEARINFLKMAASTQTNDVISVVGLAQMYEDGKKVPQDFSESYKWWLIAAERGMALAQFQVGYYLSIGQGVPKNLIEAAKWYAQAAAQEHVYAQLMLAAMYEHGEGVPQNNLVAFRWYKRAANKGIAEAQFKLGLFYNTGDSGEKNLQKAIEWYKKAAQQGHAGALNNLGLLYENGIGIERNKREALRLYKQAADIGSDVGEQNYRRLLREKEEHDRRIREQREWDQLMRR